MLDWLRSIPDVIWSGVIAAILTSAITLSGVLLSNRGSTIRLRMQLQHDADQKAAERLAVLRRDVYLRAAEETVRAGNHLANIPTLDPTKVNIAEGLEGVFIALARLSLVADPPTAYLANDLAAAYTALLFKFAQRSLPIQGAMSAIELRTQYYERETREVDRILSAMTQFNESGNSNPAIFESLEASFRFHQQQAQKIAAERSALWQERNAAHTAFARDLLGEIRHAVDFQVQLMAAIRREFGLDTNQAEFTKRLEANIAGVREHLEGLLKEMESDKD